MKTISFSVRQIITSLIFFLAGGLYLYFSPVTEISNHYGLMLFLAAVVCLLPEPDRKESEGEESNYPLICFGICLALFFVLDSKNLLLPITSLKKTPVFSG